MTCAYMNYCSGHGTCSQTNGECICDKNWAGADCGERVYKLTAFFNRKWIIDGAQWTYFSYDESLFYNENYTLSLTSDRPMDIYMTAGPISQAQPTEFNFDLSLKQ